MTPDPWQTRILESRAMRMLVCCSRQTGKSSTAAALAIKTALVEAPATILIISRGLRQAVEVLRKVKSLYNVLSGKRGARWKTRGFIPRKLADQWEESEFGSRVVTDNQMTLELANGSRIMSLPCSPDTAVGYTINLLIIDEAARVPDATYKAVRPMVIACQGRIIALSTPYGMRGWFYEAWQRFEANADESPWETTKVMAEECPRLSPEALEEERREIGDRWYRQEYCCSFEAMTGGVFRPEDINAALIEGRGPLLLGGITNDPALVPGKGVLTL